MGNLDETDAFSRYDKSDMLSLLLGFPNDVAQTASICENADMETGDTPRALALLGMGGSGIAGRLFTECTAGELPIPTVLANGYDLPAATDEKALAIALSFSGNTAETLAITNAALKRGARVVAITSGGKLKRLCKSSNSSIIEIPGGRPPRTALAFLALPVFEIAERAGLIGRVDLNSLAGYMDEIKSVIQPEMPEERNAAKQLARAIYKAADTRIYGVGIASVVATRLRGQLAENSKVFASEHTFPEMCHNELVPFSENDNRGRLAIMLRVGTEGALLRKQIELSLEIMREQGVEVFEIKPKTDVSLNGLFELIYVTDFASYYLAMLREQDPTSIDNIIRLKEGITR